MKMNYKLQEYEPGYTAPPPPKKAQLVDVAVTIRYLSSFIHTQNIPKRYDTKKEKPFSKFLKLEQLLF